MDKRTHIINTAQLLFAQFGLKKVTTDDIARLAHISKATVYKYYKNKAEIFDDVVNTESNQLLQEIQTEVDAQSGAVEKLRAHLMTRLKKVNDFVNFYRVSKESWSDYWPHIARIRMDFLNSEKNLVKEILETGVFSGELEIKDTNMAAHVLVTALASVEYQWSLSEMNISLNNLVDTMLEMMTEGIKKRF